jgi:iron complex outermembrane receptor protein
MSYANAQLLILAMLLAVFPVPGFSQESETSDTDEPDRIHGASHDHKVLEEIIVTATPLARNVMEMSQSATVLSGAALEREVANNLGDTLARIPGLSNASFGQNVGRPVIRGFDGARVGVLTNNMAVGDASAVSQDHAVAVEPFLSDQIEILRGPATLLYGSGAIGGVVNMVTHTIPQELPENGFAARAMAQGDTAADQRFAAARLDAGTGQFAFHASGFYRRTDDYEIPGAAELFPEEDDHEGEEGHEEEHGEEDGEDHHEENSGVLENSFLDNEGGSLGASWIGDKWRFGLSWTNYSSEYGIPGAHGHAHEEEEHEHEEEGHEEEHEEEGHEEELVSIDLDSDRYEAELVGTSPFAGFEQLKLRMVETSYTHTEFEGTEIGTVFENDTTDARLELRHNPVGIWKGAFGGQYTERDFEAIGEEAFVPPSKTKTAALFWVESAEFEDLQLDMGLRYDDVSVRADTLERRSFSPFSASLGAVWHFTESTHFTVNVAHAERAPTDQELFADGPHIATQTFELGDDTLNTEKNLHLEAGFRLHQGNLTGSLTFYQDFFDDYIYQTDTGEEEDGFPVRQWSQQDADFKGAELELRYDLGRFSSGHWQLFGFADAVRAELSDNSDVPRVPPQRFGLGVDWDLDSWAANITWISASSHTRVADYETPTPGYDLLNADLSYVLPTDWRSEWELFLKGQNLLDEDIRNSTSFLKDQAPQIGRNIILGVRAYF